MICSSLTTFTLPNESQQLSSPVYFVVGTAIICITVGVAVVVGHGVTCWWYLVEYYWLYLYLDIVINTDWSLVSCVSLQVLE